MLKILEMYCGIGGVAAAVGERARVVAALDISPHVLDAYRHNFRHPTRQTDVLSTAPEDLARYDADLWWMSPPCQPYTVRGKQRDLDDVRAASFIHLMSHVARVRPRFVGFENVEGFRDSRGRDLLLESLDGYAIDERVLCPSQLGIPNRRPRYYLVAARDGFEHAPSPPSAPRFEGTVDAYVEPQVDETLFLPEAIVEKYGEGLHLVDEGDRDAVTATFTGAYGKSWTYSGSYYRHADGRIRFFSPHEVLRFLHFPPTYRFPDSLHRRQRWKYAGNSLAVAAVREVLRPVLGDAPPGE